MKAIPAAIAIILIVASGYVHGMWTGRWQSSEALVKAALSVTALPEQFGDWVMVGESTVSEDEKTTAELAASISRQYRHQRSGDTVSVLLMVGKPGPISVHPPTACYTGLGYQQIGATRAYICELPESDGVVRRHHFLSAQFMSPKNSELSQPQVYWGWSSDGVWSSPDNPRLAFVGTSTLFKLYLAFESGGRLKDKQGNPAEHMLNELLPVLSKVVFTHI